MSGLENFEIEKEEFELNIELDGKIDGNLSFTLDEILEENNIEIKDIMEVTQVYVGYKYPRITDDYLIENLEPIIEFIDRNENSYAALSAYMNKITHYFPNCLVKLELYEDPEDSETIQLLITIIFKGNPAKASSQLCFLENDNPELLEFDFIILDIEFV